MKEKFVTFAKDKCIVNMYREYSIEHVFIIGYVQNRTGIHKFNIMQDMYLKKILIPSHLPLHLRPPIYLILSRHQISLQYQHL
jgi:hypothetical protein